MFKDLLVLLSGAATDRFVVDAAAAMATALDAHVTVLNQIVLPTPAPAAWGLVPDILHDPLYEKLREIGRDTATRWSEQLAKTGAVFDVRTVENFGSLSPVAGEHALYSDVALIALPGHAASVEPDLRWMFGSLALHAHRPVLVVPATHLVTLPPRRVVVAWQSTPAAARAVQDAMPLLESAERVDVLMVKPKGSSVDPTATGTDIAGHLARHGIVVDVVIEERGDDSTGTAILRHCADVEAHLLVCGGYGHLRMTEWAFGGVTRELLTSAYLPILFSH